MQKHIQSELDEYFRVRTFTGEIAGRKIAFSSKPGLPAWNQIPATAILTAHYLEARAQKRILHLGCGHGALTSWLAMTIQEAEVFYADLLEPCLQMTRLSLDRNRLENATALEGIDLPERLHGTFDLAIIQLPRGRELARRWLVQAWEGLQLGGELYISGANRTGIRPALNDCGELFGEQAVLGYKKGCRVARFFRGENRRDTPEWARQPGICAGTWIETKATIHGLEHVIRSLPGVFSAERLDEGTQLLLEYANLTETERVLDFGCGSGVIGLAAAAKAAHVALVDANLYAVAASQENLRGCANAQIFAGDLIQPVADQRYNRILCNPPFHSGRETDFDLSRTFVAGAARLLQDDGELWLVANHFLPYTRYLKTWFSDVNVVAKTNKYTLYQASKP